MRQSNSPYGTQPSNSSKRLGSMFFHLEEVILDGYGYLTELTWRFVRHGVVTKQYYPVRHPGSTDLDASLAQIQPDYRPPRRYSDLVVCTAFLTDYEGLPPGTPIFGASEKQIQTLRAYLANLPRTDRSYEVMLRPLQDYYTPEGATAIMSSMAQDRQDALRSR